MAIANEYHCDRGDLKTKSASFDESYQGPLVLSSRWNIINWKADMQSK